MKRFMVQFVVVLVGAVVLSSVAYASLANAGSVKFSPRPATQVVDKIRQALQKGQLEGVLKLIQENNLTVTQPLTGRSDSILHLVATGQHDEKVAVEVLQTLVMDDTVVDGQNASGMTALHYAVIGGRLQIAELLLVHSARPDIKDQIDKSPIDYARENQHQELVTLLQTYAMAHRRATGEQDTGAALVDAVEEGRHQVPDFLVDLNALALAGGIDPIVGRVDEMRMVLEALSQRRKNNPMLVGAAGVGKTAIVEGIAYLVATGQAPDDFRDKTFYAIDIGMLVAGTGARGALEERVQELLKFAEQNTDTLFFIDEVHLITGDEADGGVSIANLLKPALARGTLRTIGATTEADYRSHILPDKALVRRFMKISIVPPSEADAIEIALAARDHLAAHHRLEIADEAVVAAVELSYLLPDQNLPDVALALLDEAAAAQNNVIAGMQFGLRDLQAKISWREALLQRKKRNPEIRADLKQLKATRKQRQAGWEKATATSEQMTKVEADISAAELQRREHERQGNADAATVLKSETLPNLYAQRTALLHSGVLLRQHIAAVIARKLGIPVEKILKGKQGKIAELATHLREHIVGQDAALQAIEDTLIVSYAGLGDKQQTLGAFMLLGPTGVGKTFTARKLAEILFGDENSLIRFDMSEFMEAHTISTLIGAPPGYVGFGTGGKLTEAVRRMPHAVILFDEAEKAHPQFQNILLQILDGAHLGDRSGETVDFSHTVIVMTSNSDNIEHDFRPEVRNRIDRTLTFNALDRSMMDELVQKEVADLNVSLQDKEIVISLSDAAVQKLSRDGFDSEFGARPLRRVFRILVKQPLARLILKGELNGGGHYRIDLTTDGIKLTPAAE